MDAKDWGQQNKSARTEGATIRADYLQEEVRRQYKSLAVSGKDRTETYAVDGARRKAI